MIDDVVWRPILPPLYLTALLLITLLLIVWSLFRGFRSKKRMAIVFLLRTAILSVLAVMLFQPRHLSEEVTVLKPQLAILVDGSASMTDPVDPKQPRRDARVLEWFNSPSIKRARDDFDVRVFRFDKNVTEWSDKPDSIKFDGQSSQIAEAVSEVKDRFRGQPLAGILLVSDGISSTSAPPLATTNFPVMTFSLETPFAQKQRQSSVSILSADYPSRVAIGHDVTISVLLSGSEMSGKVVSVELWREGSMVSKTPVSFNDSEQTRTASFTLTEMKAGLVPFEVRLNDPLAGKEGKTLPILIHVMESGNRVTFIENSLGFDFKFLRRALASNKNIQLSTYVRLPEGRLAMIDGSGMQSSVGLDFSPKSLATCSAVILGDLSGSAITDQVAQALVNFVDQGGGLILVGGSQLFEAEELVNSPLAKVLPVKLPAPYREGKFGVRLTAAGLHHPVFGPLFEKVADFPSLLSINESPGTDPDSETLMEAISEQGAKPLVTTKRFGKGKVVAILSNTLWRWRLAAGSNSTGVSPYDAFWNQLTDWVIPKEGKDNSEGSLELFMEKTSFELGENPEIHALLKLPASQGKTPATLPLAVKTPDGKKFDYLMKTATFRLPDGSQVQGYSSQVDAHVPGLFQATSSFQTDTSHLTAETRFLVTKPATEITGKPIGRDFLKKLAESSGGKFYEIDHWEEWTKDLHYSQQKFKQTEFKDLWNTPIILALIGIFLCIEWIIRKIWNLP